MFSHPFIDALLRKLPWPGSRDGTLTDDQDPDNLSQEELREVVDAAYERGWLAHEFHNANEKGTQLVSTKLDRMKAIECRTYLSQLTQAVEDALCDIDYDWECTRVPICLAPARRFLDETSTADRGSLMEHRRPRKH